MGVELTWRRTLPGAVAFVLLVAIGWGYWIWTHPTLLGSPGGTTAFGPHPRGSSVSGGVSFGPEHLGADETITLHSVTAHFASNGARATASFAICVTNKTKTTLGSSAPGELLTDYCRQVRPVKDGAKLHLFRHDPGLRFEYVVMTIRTTRAGTSRIDSVSFDYSRSGAHFHQHGTETSNQAWIVRATD